MAPYLAERSKKKRPARRVLIVGSGSLFDEGLKSLLTHRAKLEVSNIAYLDDSTFTQSVLHVDPDVIVLFEGSPLSVGRVFELLKDIPDLTTLRVITVLAENNTVDIYEKKHITTARSDDLITLIQHA